MNCIFGKFNWAAPNNGFTRHDFNSYSDENVTLHVERTSNFDFDTKALYYNPNANVVCIVIGYISNLSSIKSTYGIHYSNDVEVVSELYSLNTFESILDLEGIYTIVILDKQTQKTYVFQDEYASTLPIYYTYNNNELIISTTIKQLLKNSTIKRELNMEAVRIEICYFFFFL